MTDLVTTFREFVEREQLFTKTDKLLLACSGGLDSTVLAHLLHAEGYDFAIAHMNFQLRGEASNEDAAFVEDLARTLGAKFFLKAVDAKKEALPGESTQMVARRLRYQWFDEIVIEQDCSMLHLVIAHHLEDNFETVLMNLIRGTGFRGISGIEPKSESIYGLIPHTKVRPLLNSSRASILAYARAKNLNWREDESNASDNYLRNRIRHHLAPVFYDEFGMSINTWANTANNLRADERIYRHGFSAVFKEVVINDWGTGEMLVIDRTAFPKGIDQLAFLRSLPLRENSFTNEEFKQIITVPGQRTIEGKNMIAYVTPKTWSFDFKTYGDKSLPATEIKQLPCSLKGGHHKLTIELVPRPEVLNTSSPLFLAPLPLPLHLRPRRKGDRFQPLGMGGKSKKVKDYMIDEKVPVWLRDQIYLLCNADDEIMAITGYCISEKFKVLPHHTEVLRISTAD
ncbi:tRNA lysidine(34) synthetase TilS [Neolewinella aurantiaca]|uniref:tRNA(Ile)-lysidine synthase n=1 Tax=Neolewinella aurantiaca TaxID=2602767 RepID=A0A5C7FIX0_9BACT|nr:tRNA lysidine(34) synthetase TilS [Neolewinella aurantiaca]TXF89763.1 tRNA lysidine(34) synthetase TilS [Neolewinella aurantiaca]